MIRAQCRGEIGWTTTVFSEDHRKWPTEKKLGKGLSCLIFGQQPDSSRSCRVRADERLDADLVMIEGLGVRVPPTTRPGTTLSLAAAGNDRRRRRRRRRRLSEPPPAFPLPAPPSLVVVFVAEIPLRCSLPECLPLTNSQPSPGRPRKTR